MAHADAITFTRLADGTMLQRQPDWTFRPVATGSDRGQLAALTEEAIEHMSAFDPDHPGLDDAFWDDSTVGSPDREAVSIQLDSDVLRYFRRAGRGYQARINAVLRRHMLAVGKGR
ncbi:BrnA antitoxin family protein [Methylobacterium sp. J-088]|uniref:BrnA antitoxin family protein n=1 Tax=unclassified Methylobacterium TaxID=2615210 RepID=UPI001FB9A24D|nr:MULTISPECIES: BrnA antitoxin family protein [unclassified Methylobacterium]MCJ2064431.1 BrnA antitoxin family protein [Methylobacterium sp. J-088]